MGKEYMRREYEVNDDLCFPGVLVKLLHHKTPESELEIYERLHILSSIKWADQQIFF